MIKRLIALLFPLFLQAASENIWETVGRIYGIEPTLLYSIAKVESALDRYVVALSYDKMSEKQQKELMSFLAKYGIASKMHTKVFAIRSKNKFEATKVVNFLYARKYPRFDMGIMQINSIHKPLLDKANIRFEDLFDPRVNIQVGAYILATCFEKHKNAKDAINAYNGKINDNPYSAKVFAEFKKLYGSYQSGKTQLYYRNPS